MNPEQQAAELAAMFETALADNDKLKHLVQEYDSYLKSLAPYTYEHGRVVMSLHQEAKELGIDMLAPTAPERPGAA